MLYKSRLLHRYVTWTTDTQVSQTKLAHPSYKRPYNINTICIENNVSKVFLSEICCCEQCNFFLNCWSDAILINLTDKNTDSVLMSTRVIFSNCNCVIMQFYYLPINVALSPFWWSSTTVVSSLTLVVVLVGAVLTPEQTAEKKAVKTVNSEAYKL